MGLESALERAPERRTVVNAVALVAVLAVVVPFVIVGVPQLVGASQSYVVMSGSMEPTFGPGDVILVEDVEPSAVGEGDVITYGTGPDDRTTHRVVEAYEENGERYFVTKGDANEDVDGSAVPEGAVEARLLLVIPYLGHAVLFAKSDLGIVLLMIVPGTLLIVSEAWSLYRAWDANGDESADADADYETNESDTERDDLDGPRDGILEGPEPTEDD